MGRPLSVSDDAILKAAGKVISRRGPDAFSVAEVASELGLSRAAIILRFESTHALKMTLLTRQIEQFAVALEGLPTSPSGDNLLQVAAFIGKHAGGRENSARFFASYSGNLREPDLLELERRRGDLLNQAISRVMPAVAIDHASAIKAFRNHLTGSIMEWLSLEATEARRFLVMRTQDWLNLTRIPFSENVVKSLAGPFALPRARKASGSTTKPPNAKRTRPTD